MIQKGGKRKSKELKAPTSGGVQFVDDYLLPADIGRSRRFGRIKVGLRKKPMASGTLSR